MKGETDSGLVLVPSQQNPFTQLDLIQSKKILLVHNSKNMETIFHKNFYGNYLRVAPSTFSSLNKIPLVSLCQGKPIFTNSYFSILFSPGFPGGSEVKNPPVNAGDAGSGEGKGNSLQYSCPENSVDRGDWWATVQEVTRSRTRLND